MKRDYPTWICNDCGVKYCKGTSGSKHATFHIGACQCCMASDVPVTEPRDYGHFVEWPVRICSANAESVIDKDLGKNQRPSGL